MQFVGYDTYGNGLEISEEYVFGDTRNDSFSCRCGDAQDCDCQPWDIEHRWEVPLLQDGLEIGYLVRSCTGSVSSDVATEILGVPYTKINAWAECPMGLGWCKCGIHGVPPEDCSHNPELPEGSSGCAYAK